MRIEENYLYFLKDEHFKQNKKYKLFTDYENKNKGERPYYVCFKKQDVCWVIPLSTQVDKYKSFYEKEIQRFGNSTKFHFITLYGKESVMLIQNAFPIAYKNINKPYIKNNIQMKISNISEIKSIKKKFNRMISLINKGVIFYPHQPNVLALEKELLAEYKFDKYVENLRSENIKLKSPLKLDEPILNMIKEYNKQFNEPKTLKDICNDYKADKESLVKNPLLQSIGVYFATQQQNELNIDFKEIEVSKKEIAFSLDQE